MSYKITKKEMKLQCMTILLAIGSFLVSRPIADQLKEQLNIPSYVVGVIIIIFVLYLIDKKS